MMMMSAVALVSMMIPLTRSKQIVDTSFYGTWRAPFSFFDYAGRAIAPRSGVMYVYITDFGGWAVLPKVEAPPLSLREAYPAIENDLAAVRSRLNEAGLGCHKEAIGLPDALGYQVIQKERRKTRLVRRAAKKP